MGVGGVPFPYGEQEIKDAIIKHQGVMAKVAQELNCGHDCIYRHFNKYPALKPILEECRYGRREKMLDNAEDVLEYAMSECKEKDLANALKASFFFLNNRGKDRGYSAIEMQNKEEKDQALSAIRELTDALRPSKDDE